MGEIDFPPCLGLPIFFFLPFGQSDGATDRTTTQNNRGEKMEGRKGGGKKSDAALVAMKGERREGRRDAA